MPMSSEVAADAAISQEEASLIGKAEADDEAAAIARSPPEESDFEMKLEEVAEEVVTTSPPEETLLLETMGKDALSSSEEMPSSTSLEMGAKEASSTPSLEEMGKDATPEETPSTPPLSLATTPAIPSSLPEETYLGVKASWLKEWIDELFSTESSVVGTLYIVRNYVKPVVLQKIRGWKDGSAGQRLERAERYFKNLEEVLEIHKKMLKCISAFRKNVEDRDELGKALELVAKVAEFFRFYGSYVKSYAGVNELFRMIVHRWDNELFAEFVRTECAGLSLQSMLIQPLQRLSKYELFFSDLEKRIDPRKVPVVKDKVSRTLLRIRKSVKAVEHLAKRLEAQDVVYDYFLELDHKFGCVDDMIQPHIFFLAEFPKLYVTYRSSKKSNKLVRRPCELVLFTDFALVVVPASVRHRVALGTRRKKYAKFRLELTETIFVGHRDADVWVLHDAAAPTTNSQMVHVSSPATTVTTDTYVKLSADTAKQRDDVLQALNQQKIDLKDRRDSFCTTPGSVSSVRSLNGGLGGRSHNPFMHSPRRLPSTPTRWEPTPSSYYIQQTKQSSRSWAGVSTGLPTSQATATSASATTTTTTTPKMMRLTSFRRRGTSQPPPRCPDPFSPCATHENPPLTTIDE